MGYGTILGEHFVYGRLWWKLLGEPTLGDTVIQVHPEGTIRVILFQDGFCLVWVEHVSDIEGSKGALPALPLGTVGILHVQDSHLTGCTSSSVPGFENKVRFPRRTGQKVEHHGNIMWICAILLVRVR